MYSPLAIVYDPIFLKHGRAQNSQQKVLERDGRLMSILRYLKIHNMQLPFLKPYYCSDAVLKLAHDHLYIDRVKNAYSNQLEYLDEPECLINKWTDLVSRYAVGAVLKAVDSIEAEEYLRIFCLIRPPGHHAQRSKAMGFCYFNNLGIGVLYLLKRYAFKKVFILDWDFHHGNGTEDLFKNNSSVFYASLHAKDSYPNTGNKENETENSVCIPVERTISEKDYFNLFEKIINRIKVFNPDYLFISAGFDAHKEDPLGAIDFFSAKTFGNLTKKLVQLNSKLKIISVLEGGYHFNSLAESVYHHLLELRKEN